MSLNQHSCPQRSKSLFTRYGQQILIAAKFIPGLGAIMPPLAGALGMKRSRFFLFDGLGSLFYGAFYVVVGFVFHNQLLQVLAALKQVGLSALVSLLVVVVAYIAFKYARRHKATRRAEPQTMDAPAVAASLPKAL